MPTPIPVATDPLCGTPRGYKWKRKICRCEGCRDAATRENMRYAYKRVTKSTDKLVSAKEVREKLKYLKRHGGYSYNFVARQTGMSRRGLGEIVNGTKKYVRTSYAQRFNKFYIEMTRLSQLGQKPADRKRVDHVEADRTQRAIQGLMRQGYSQLYVEKETGVSQQTLSLVCIGEKTHVAKDTEEKVVRFSREVGLQPGPSQRTRAMAERRGYASLAEWDDLI